MKTVEINLSALQSFGQISVDYACNYFRHKRFYHSCHVDDIPPMRQSYNFPQRWLKNKHKTNGKPSYATHATRQFWMYSVSCTAHLVSSTRSLHILGTFSCRFNQRNLSMNDFWFCCRRTVRKERPTSSCNMLGRNVFKMLVPAERKRIAIKV